MRDAHFTLRNRVIVDCKQCCVELSKPRSLINKRDFCNVKCLGARRGARLEGDVVSTRKMHTPVVHEKSGKSASSSQLTEK